MSAMILTKKKSLIFLIFSLILTTSCETFEELAGLDKANINDSLYEGTPDLILPPDFNKDPTSFRRTKNTNQQISQANYQQILSKYEPGFNVGIIMDIKTMFASITNIKLFESTQQLQLNWLV